MNMKEILTNYRYYVLVMLGTIAIIGLIASPSDSLSFGKWLCVFVATKVVALLAGFTLYVFMKYWASYGTIPELMKFLKQDC
jgi:hypothetical protein